MLEAGMSMVAHHPWLGLGPDMVSDVYPIYVARQAPHRNNPHLHNNLMQIAAERGLPCLVAWLWLLGVVLVAAVRSFRKTANDPQGRALAAGTLGVVVSGFVAGMGEYNFGDSEFQMLFLFSMAIPWILHGRSSATPT
jgi:O-antigen ligase